MMAEKSAKASDEMDKSKPDKESEKEISTSSKKDAGAGEGSSKQSKSDAGKGSRQASAEESHEAQQTEPMDAADGDQEEDAEDSDSRSRSTRSRNPEFAAKQRNFIKDVKRSIGEKDEDEGAAKKRRRSQEASSNAAAAANDNFCWVCHRDGRVICCETCPRVFHLKCAGLSTDPPGDWVCVECRRVVQAEAVENLSPAMKMLTPERFTLLLKHAIGRLKGLSGAEPFTAPVDPNKFPTYSEVVACPMDLSTMEANLELGQYGSTEAFVADCKWILHNCILFNGTNSKLTGLAKSLLRMCKWEMEEIETCPDCYSNAYNSDNWFTEACPQPHLLIWARLKGFPFWPAKAVKFKDGNVDCRFFGRHDRAWVPIKECYLFSREPPTPPKGRSKSLDASIEELEEHVRNLEAAFGAFVYPPPRTPYDQRKVRHQLKMMLPGYHVATNQPETKQKRKSTSAGNKPTPATGEKQRPAKRPAQPAAPSPPAVAARATPPPAKVMRQVKKEVVTAERPAREDSPPPESPPPPQLDDEEEEEPLPTPAAASQFLRVPVSGGAMKVLPASALRALSVVQTPQGTLKKVIKLDGTPVNMQQLQLVPMRGQQQPNPSPAPVAAAPTPTATPAVRPRLQPVREPAAPSPVAREAPASTGSPAGRGRGAASGGGGGGRRSSVLVPLDSSSFNIAAPTVVGPMMLVPGRETAPASAAAAAPSSGHLAAQDAGLTELIQGGLDDALAQLERASAPAAALAALRLQLDRLQWRHQMELAEQRKVNDTMLAELRSSMEIEQKKAVNRLLTQMASERAQWARQTELSVNETKRKQWCAACGNEAIFYCCWNTSYCDFPCQEAQWPKHMLTCANQQGAEEPPPSETPAPEAAAAAEETVAEPVQA